MSTSKVINKYFEYFIKQEIVLCLKESKVLITISNKIQKHKLYL